MSRRRRPLVRLLAAAAVLLVLAGTAVLVLRVHASREGGAVRYTSRPPLVDAVQVDNALATLALLLVLAAVVCLVVAAVRALRRR
ncbi:hypothetical protein DEI92_05865 [Curtobacterium sp. MCBD17_034]|uniref:hypothetical protein n=1 Tax=unclassified Curtobacterium TaxID=257496 RepID=UPI000DA6DE48|nr:MULTISPECIES: hypothetical protein [unclassified Curtobacterium]PZF61124.1 hypothetical protein DEI92_05865 [Curtobacterium sp. MCBD17_034]PZM40473.1 hypothetical protein DEI90_02100 [Curtobacterium sp. MCBD17_031]